MKKLSFFNKIIFILNNIATLLLLLAIVSPYVKPSTLSLAPLISLTTPILIFINLLFVAYWVVIGFKKQLILSTLVLLLGYFISPPIFKIMGSNDHIEGVKIMSFNVRVFNLFKWIKDDTVTDKMIAFIENEDPSVLAIQEYFKSEKIKLNFPYNYIKIKDKSENVGLAIYSKHPIINKGSLDFKNTLNNAIFCDVTKGKDTIRIYNIHLESLNIIPNEDFFGQKNSDKLFEITTSKFKQQEKQIELINDHIKNCKYKIIIATDLNNTAYSWTYKNLKNDFKDSFLEAGSGFGKTYDFKGFPLRIDYIFVDERLKVNAHKNYEVKYSDHYPIMATISL